MCLHRLEGYKLARAKARAQGVRKKHVYFSTFIVEVTADNMEDVCGMSRQINDSNLEFNSKKSVAQEVYACYEINDKSQDEMDRIVSKEVRKPPASLVFVVHSGEVQNRD